MSARVSTLRVAGGAPVRREDDVAVEEPLEIRIAGDPWLVTLRTPGHDHELVMGLLLAEGLISSRDDIGTIAHCGRPDDGSHGNVIDVRSAPGADIDVEQLETTRRALGATAACGLCGRRSIDDLLTRVAPIDDPLGIDHRTLVGLAARLSSAQPSFARTGGLHAAGIARSDGELCVVREDVGRHNAVDKAVGRLVLDGESMIGRVLVVSGRAGFEIVTKAVVARIAVLVAIGAPSSLAVATAERSNLTLVGFCRDGSFNVYAGFERVRV